MPRKIPDLEACILKAAAELFSLKGYAEVSMKDVALRAGTSVGNLYNYYPAKKDLFLAGRHRWMERFDEEFISVDFSGISPRQVLENAIIKVGEMSESKKGLYEEFLEVARTELGVEELSALRESMREEFKTHILATLEPLVRQCLNPRSRELLGDDGLRTSFLLITVMKSVNRFFVSEPETNRAFLGSVLDIFCAEE